MKRKVPPLKALLFFESAAIYLSFTKAAEQMNVTNAAVSHQVKLLEEFLDTPLFFRNNNKLILTTAGQRFLPRVATIFNDIEEATNLIIDDRTTLRVAVTPVFAAKWLIPKLYKFYRDYPNIRVEVIAKNEINYHLYDISISENNTLSNDFFCSKFTKSHFMPVCAPQLAKKIKSLNDLNQINLLHDRNNTKQSSHLNWKNWLLTAENEQHITKINFNDGLGFSDSLLAIQAAIDGQGVALVQNIFVTYDILAGRLVCPLNFKSDASINYYLIHPQSANTELCQLCSWLGSQL